MADLSALDRGPLPVVVYVVQTGVIAGMPPGTLARLSELGVVFMVSGFIERTKLAALFGYAVDVRFDMPHELERARPRAFNEVDAMDNREEG